MMVPRRFGGHAVSMETVLRVSAELAKGCPSTSWVQTLMNVSSWFATRSAHRLQEDIFNKTVKPRLCGGLMPSCDLQAVHGGLRVTGALGLYLGLLAFQLVHLRSPDTQ